ncbi:MAG: T9SS type A sorting domain-containing protein [Bacteroidota bacterium]
MKTQTMKASVLTGIFLICIFAISGFGQATGPPDCDSMQVIENIKAWTKGLGDKEDCIELKLSPNPIRNSATLEFELSESATVQISVYNQQGLMVLDVVRQKFDAGKNKITFSPSELQTGTYYICLTTGKKKGMQRCVII